MTRRQERPGRALSQGPFDGARAVARSLRGLPGPPSLSSRTKVTLWYAYRAKRATEWHRTLDRFSLHQS
jgi:hypothetical protein